MRVVSGEVLVAYLALVTVLMTRLRTPAPESSMLLTRRTPPPVEDTTPPEIPVILDTTESTASSRGRTVEYKTPPAADTVDNDVTVSCAPPSGNFFKAQTTTPVTCTATDDAGNKAERSFNIKVLLTDDVNSTPQPRPAGTGISTRGMTFGR